MTKVDAGDASTVSEAVNKTINKIQGEIEERDAKLKQYDEQMLIIAKECQSLERQVRNRGCKLEILKQLAAVLKGVAPEITKLRNMLLSLRAQLPREDITIACKKELDTSISKLEKDLVKICEHQFLVGYVGYRGRHSDDYDDTFHGQRMCVVCGYTETATKWTGGHYIILNDTELYPTLNEQEGRLITRHKDFQASRYSKKSFDIWRPLDDLLTIFVDERAYKILKEAIK